MDGVHKHITSQLSTSSCSSRRGVGRERGGEGGWEGRGEGRGGEERGGEGRGNLHIYNVYND